MKSEKDFIKTNMKLKIRYLSIWMDPYGSVTLTDTDADPKQFCE